MLTLFSMKILFLEHFRHKSIFRPPFPKLFLTFEKWTKINVQNRKPNLLFGKKLLLKNISEIYIQSTRAFIISPQKF